MAVNFWQRFREERIMPAGLAIQADHRRMYIDLLRAALWEQGLTQRALAERIGVSAPYISRLLQPEWDAPADTALTPTPERARQIGQALGRDAAWQEQFEEHIAASQKPPPWLIAAETPLAPEEVRATLDVLGRLYEAANAAANGDEARGGYAGTLRLGAWAIPRIDARTAAVARAQVLMYLHDAACVLDRAGRALAMARDAARLLDELPARPTRTDAETHARLRVNAAMAEAVALRNLGLHEDAWAVAEQAQRLPAFPAASSVWRAPLLADQLSALRHLRRFRIRDAEALHDEAMALYDTGDPWQAVLDDRLAKVLLAGGPRGRRQARALVERGRDRALYDDRLSLLQRVLLLRTAARQAYLDGDRAMWQHWLHHCLHLIDAAGLAHQRADLAQEYPGERLDIFGPGPSTSSG